MHQVALAELLEDKRLVEWRVTELERRLEQACQAVRQAEENAATLRAGLERAETTVRENTTTEHPMTGTESPPAVAAAEINVVAAAPAPVPATTAATEAATAAAAEAEAETEAEAEAEAAAQVAAEVAAAATVVEAPRPAGSAGSAGSAGPVGLAATESAETALSDALEAVEELEARCALAHARELEVTRKASARIDKLTRELEEANENGPKAVSYTHLTLPTICSV